MTLNNRFFTKEVIIYYLLSQYTFLVIDFEMRF